MPPELAAAGHRTGVIIRHNVTMLRGEPGPVISRLVMPLVVITLLRPLYGDPGQAVVAGLVLFSLLGMSVVATSMLNERLWHTADRLRSSPARPLEILLGKAAPTFAVLVTQQTLILAYGVLFLGLRVNHPALVALAVLAWSLTLLCLGLLIGMLVRSPGHLSATVDIGSVALTSFAGALVPLALLPGWARAIAPASPGYWAADAVRSALAGDASHTYRAVAILTATALAALAGAVATTRPRHRR